MIALAKHFVCDDTGATAIEYGLIAALVALVIIGSVSKLGTTLNAKFSAINTHLANGS